MRKLFIYLMLIGCFKSFTAATPGLLYKARKISNITKIKIPVKKDALQQGSDDLEIYRISIFCLRYF